MYRYIYIYVCVYMYTSSHEEAYISSKVRARGLESGCSLLVGIRVCVFCLSLCGYVYVRVIMPMSVSVCTSVLPEIF